MENSKKRLLLIIGAVVAVALICVVLVGIISGTWPWNGKDVDENNTGMTTTSGENDTEGTDESNITGTVDTTEGTGEAGGNTGSNTDSNTGSNTETGSTQPPKPSIGLEIEDPDSTDGTEETLGENAVIDFDKLLEGLNGNG